MSIDDFNGDLLSRAGVVRRVCPVFFLLDCSGSMSGLPIGAVNSAMEDILPKLAEMNANNPDAEMKVAILKFGGDKSGYDVAEWVTGNDGLVELEGYRWENYLEADGGTPMGEAFGKLNKALSVKDGFMKRASGSVAPVLFLLSDGRPTDEALVEVNLQKLKQNNWYKLAIRVAVGYGDYDRNTLVKFTQNEETVLETNDPNVLAKKIKFVVVRSSMVASRGSSSINTDKNMSNTDKVAEEIKNFGPETATDVNGAIDVDEEW